MQELLLSRAAVSWGPPTQLHHPGGRGPPPSPHWRGKARSREPGPETYQQDTVHQCLHHGDFWSHL